MTVPPCFPPRRVARSRRQIVFLGATLLACSGTARPSFAAWPPTNARMSAQLVSRANSVATPDGLGGVIVAWEESYRGSTDLYAQRLDASGSSQWGAVGVAVSTAAGSQQFPAIVADGTGGAIIAWRDNRAGVTDIYTQRVSAAGVAQWTADGVPLCVATGAQSAPAIVSDGAGGAIVAWQDNRAGNLDIYARRVTNAGAPQWTVDGVALCTSIGSQQSPGIISDGAGGAIVAWEDLRGAAYDIYIRRITSAGAPQWTANGIALCTAIGNQRIPVLASDGVGGAIVAWEDLRGAAYDIYARRITNAGAPQWTADGVALCAAAGTQGIPCITQDGAGGAIVAWNDGRGSAFDIFAQRISSAGTAAWTADGVTVCSASGDQFSPAIVLDGVGGAIVAWQDFRVAADGGLYSRRITLAGVTEGASDGVAACTAPGTQTPPALIADGAGGAIMTWDDPRSGLTQPFALRIGGAGASEWFANGLQLCYVSNDELTPAIVADGAGGAIVAWEERYRSQSDLYAQRIDMDGTLLWAAGGVPVCTAAGVQRNPVATADGSGGVIVTWSDPRGGNLADDIYAQRIDAMGAALWAMNGVVLCQAPGLQQRPAVVADGTGGGIVVWEDQRAGVSETDIYARRASAAGAPQWTVDGVALCTAIGRQQYLKAIPDGAGGAIVAWEDLRGGTAEDIYSRRVSSTGVPIWTADGVPLCTATGRQINLRLVTDGASGALVVWEDNRLAGNSDVFARRINSAGAPQWVANGIPVCVAAGDQFGLDAIAGSGGSAIVAWVDYRPDDLTSAVYAQQVNGGGTLAWLADGAAVSPAGGRVFDLAIATDGAAGAFTAWSDGRAGKPDLYAQRMLSTGMNNWSPGGDAFAIEPGSQASPAIAATGAASAIVAWSDGRDPNGHIDVYAHRLVATGPLAVEPLPSLEAVWLAPISPNPVAGGARFRFALPREQRLRIAIYDLEGRRVALLLDGTFGSGERSIAWDGRGETGAALASGVYYARLTTIDGTSTRAFVKLR